MKKLLSTKTIGGIKSKTPIQVLNGKVELLDAVYAIHDAGNCHELRACFDHLEKCLAADLPAVYIGVNFNAYIEQDKEPTTIYEIIDKIVPYEFMGIFSRNHDEIEYLDWELKSPCGIAVELSLEAANDLAETFDKAAARDIWSAAKTQIDVICQG